MPKRKKLIDTGIQYDDLTIILNKKDNEKVKWVMEVKEYHPDFVDDLWDIIIGYMDMSTDYSKDVEIDYAFLDDIDGDIIYSKKQI